MAEGEPAGRLRGGVLGLGFAGTDIVRSLADDPFVDVVAVADPRPGARESFQRSCGGRAYDSVDGLRDDPAVDAVWVATPTHLHLDHATALASAGKHLVVEKPLAASLDEAERLAEVADKYQVALVAGGVRSFHPAFLAMRELIQSRALGPVVSVQAWVYTGWMTRPRQQYELDETRGGGCLLNQAPHVVDVIRMFCGGLASAVRAVTFSAGDLGDRRGPGGFSGWLDFADGVHATFSYNGYGLIRGRELVPWGETPRRNGDWVPGDAGLVVVTCRNGVVRQSARGLYVYGADGRRELLPADPVSAHAAEARELFAAVRHATPPPHDGRWGLATSEAVFGMLTSAASGGTAVKLSRQVAMAG